MVHRYSNPTLNYCNYWQNKVLVLKKCKVIRRNVPNMYVLGKAVMFFKLINFFFGIHKFCKSAYILKKTNGPKAQLEE